ncbi:MAG: transporter, partial [Glaciihabitans sp.]|nr:transporter [Glaciihabitans sp.]
AGIALINTVGNIAGFSAPYITGAVADATAVDGEPQYQVPMFIVGGFMLLTAILMFTLALSGKNTAANALSQPTLIK